MKPTEYRNRKTLFLGDVNSGKTTRTADILRSFLEEGEKSIALFDFAPETTRGVGGKMNLREEERGRVWTASPVILPPRLTAKTDEEAWELARENARRIEEAFASLPLRDWRVFILNDVSLYLHAGSASELLVHLSPAPTVVMNGYFGRHFGEGPLSRRENEEMNRLLSACDQIFYLPALPF